jgi:release factor glutamine methyltransferase
MATLSSIQKEITRNLVTNLGLSSRESLIEARFILEYVLKKSYSQLYLYQSISLLKSEELHIKNIIALRLKKKPLAYIFKEWDFYGETFYIDEHVLIPRQDTELLIDIVLNKYKKEIKMNICDLGTGSGIIGITLARHFNNSQVMLTDTSKEALIITKNNINKFKLKNAEAYCGDWYHKLPKIQFDLIVSNPPYIDIDDPILKTDDLQYEPKTALFSENKGYADIEMIVNNAPNYLKEGGQLIIEHGYNQSSQVKSIFVEAKFLSIKQHLDINSKIRVTSGLV